MGRLLGILVVLGLAASAGADPTLSWEISDAGGGLYGILFTVHANDGIEASFFVDIEFTNVPPEAAYCVSGEIQQLKAFGVVDVDSNEDAYDYHFAPGSGYDMYLDSYFYEPFPSNTAGGGIQEGPGMYSIEAGTGGEQYYENVTLAYFCSTGGLAWDGSISRQGINYPVSGCIPAEPGTVLMILAGAGLLLRRRR